jgi:hypothetical protein
MIKSSLKNKEMANLGLFLRLEAKPGKEKIVAEFLETAQSMVVQENFAVTWYAFRFNENTFGIFDTFSSEDSRNGHLSGRIAQQLAANASEFFSNKLDIEKLDILAAK